VKLEILLSCMNQTGVTIVKKSNICSDVLIINQCDRNDFVRIENEAIIRMISTPERGLSRSRNMAIKNSKNEICLFCDDDESLIDGYERGIMDAFQCLSDADIIIFQIDYKNKKKVQKVKKVNFFTALRVSSVQIAFKKEKILSSKICFDETIGSGVSEAGGEEVVFLYDCLKKGLKIYYYPLLIAKVNSGESKWFKGYTQKYFYDRGVFTKKMMGCLGALIYGVYFLLLKRSSYKKDISMFRAFVELTKGIYKKEKI